MDSHVQMILIVPLNLVLEVSAKLVIILMQLSNAMDNYALMMELVLQIHV